MAAGGWLRDPARGVGTDLLPQGRADGPGDAALPLAAALAGGHPMSRVGGVERAQDAQGVEAAGRRRLDPLHVTPPTSAVPTRSR